MNNNWILPNTKAFKALPNFKEVIVSLEGYDGTWVALKWNGTWLLMRKVTPNITVGITPFVVSGFMYLPKNKIT